MLALAALGPAATRVKPACGDERRASRLVSPSSAPSRFAGRIHGLCSVGQRSRQPRTQVVTRAVLSEPPASLKPADVAVEAGTTFDWYKQWYPVAILKFTAQDRPQPFTLLGRDIVLWNDGTAWRAFEDKCPHRLAPLSEGRIEKDGTLLCAYHAWRFDGSGNCTSIPQIPADQQARVRANPRACAVAYPTQEALGLLWVFASPDPTAAAFTPLPPIPELDPASLERGDSSCPAGWNFRDLPYGWEAFMENVTDPAHVPVSHHKIYGNRYTEPRPFAIAMEEPLGPGGFKTRVTGAAEGKTSIQTFSPPSLLKIDVVNNADGSALLFVLLCTPTRPGHCRHIGCNVLTKATKVDPGKKAGFNAGGFVFGQKIPPWLLHPMAGFFLHQDMVFLHSQQVYYDDAHKQGQRWEDAVFIPGQTDRAVSAFRQWLGEHGTDGRVPWAPGTDPSMPPIERDRKKLFDVYHTHSKNCTVCASMIKRLSTLQSVLRAAAFAAAACAVGTAAAAAGAALTVAQQQASSLAAVAALPAAVLSTPGALAFLAAAALLLLAAWGAGAFRELYLVYEFNHQDNN